HVPSRSSQASLFHAKESRTAQGVSLSALLPDPLFSGQPEHEHFAPSVSPHAATCQRDAAGRRPAALGILNKLGARSGCWVLPIPSPAHKISKGRARQRRSTRPRSSSRLSSGASGVAR